MFTISLVFHSRVQLARALTQPNTDDVLIITRLDRLARSTRYLLKSLDTVTKAGAEFRSLRDAWADTTTPHGRLMLTVLGRLAEFEREVIHARTSEGRARARARRDSGEESLANIGRTYKVSGWTIGRLSS